MMAGPKYLFRSYDYNLRGPADSAAEHVALKEIFLDLQETYTRKTALGKCRIVCKLSHHNLTLEHARQFATWLAENSLKLYILNLTFNHIFSASWDPLEAVITSLHRNVEYLQLGGNYLPALTETEQLSNLQASGRVSLTLPIAGSPVTEWQEKWNVIAIRILDKSNDNVISPHEYACQC